MPRETGSGSGDQAPEQRGESGDRGDAWQRVESEKPERDRARREWDATHEPSDVFEQAARPLPVDYGSDRPRHREISAEVAAEFGKTPEQIDELRAKMFVEIEARAQRHQADSPEENRGTDTVNETAETTETLTSGEGRRGDADVTANPDGDAEPAPSGAEAGSAREAPPRWELHTRVGAGRDAPTAKQVLDRFAGPEGVSSEQRLDDERYIMTHAKDRPWLAIAANQEPEVRRVYVARDRAEGHDPARHDGWRDATDQEQRAAAGKDPAHPTDSPAYHNSVDWFKGAPDDFGGRSKQHRPGEHVSWIADPTAWAVATARALDHPAVKQAMNSETPPGEVKVPLEDVLGPDGHRKCDGFSLVTDGFDSVKDARDNRNQWVAEVRAVARTQGMDHAHAERIVEQKSANGDIAWVKPEVKRIETFEGGTCQVNFKVKNRVIEGISTICYNPPEDETKGTS